jgi:hypothetical protein
LISSHARTHAPILGIIRNIENDSYDYKTFFEATVQKQTNKGNNVVRHLKDGRNEKATKTSFDRFIRCTIYGRCSPCVRDKKKKKKLIIVTLIIRNRHRITLKSDRVD